MRVPRHRRLSALGLIAMTNFGFYMLPIRIFDPEKVAILISMVTAVVIAFLFSAISHLIKFERVLYKYVISGSVGIGVGAVLFYFLKSSTILSMEWVNIKGRLVLIALNLTAGLLLFFVKQEARRDVTPKKSETNDVESNRSKEA